MLSLRELRNFVMLAETRHFGRAADRLHIAQPALSRSVKSLETKLGSPLFIRTSREVRLTSVGATLLPEAQAIIRSTDLLYERARALSSVASGTISIGFLPFVEDSAASAIEQFAATHRAVTVHHRRQYDQAIREAVSKGDLDAGIVLADPEATDGLLSERFLSLPMVAVVNEGHPLAGHGSITPADLVAHPLPTADSHSPGLLRRVLAPAFSQYGLVPEWIHVPDPVGRAPAVVERDDFVWIQTRELRRRPQDNTKVLEIDPPVMCAFSVVFRADNGNRVLELFLALVRDLVGAPHAASTSLNAEEVLDSGGG